MRKSGNSPIFLEHGARLSLFSPSGPRDSKRADDGIEILKDFGFSLGSLPKEPGHLGYLAASDKARLNTLKRAMESSRSSALLATRGGYGAMRLLGELAPLWSGFPPKPIIGFSDITALHLSRLSFQGLGGWHAPNLTTFPIMGRDNARKSVLALIGEESSPWTFSPESVVRKGESQGPLLGGNLSLFSQLYGSAFCPKSSRTILLFEDVSELPYQVDRMLTGLKLKGAFENVHAVIFGSFTSQNDSNFDLMRKVLTIFGRSLKVPVLLDAPFGHGKINMPWYYGEIGKVDTSGKSAHLYFPQRN
jgi:muramoyltetrapeptide carboxypeptidase